MVKVKFMIFAVVNQFSFLEKKYILQKKYKHKTTNKTQKKNVKEGIHGNEAEEVFWC